MADTDLKFDEPNVCTKLAEKYLNSKKEFCSIGLDPVHKTRDQCEMDDYGNKINFVDYRYTPPNVIRNKDEIEISDVSKKYMALKQKIEQNVQLFCQLEFLLRKIPISDTKNVDLELIIQSLVYKSSFLNTETVRTHYKAIRFDKNTPLFHLGLFAYKYHEFCLTIVCSKDTVAVCTLFVELCRDVGLEKDVALAVVYEQDLREGYQYDEDLSGGCVGVVTARCDVDSAVDGLLAASSRYPWRLSRVLVQESALERFTRALEWQTRDVAPADKPFQPEPVRAGARAVPVEAFRTVREALALLARRAPLAVAAWAADLAEAHELAYGARAPLVWLNGHGHFRGPPALSAALYCRYTRRDFVHRFTTENLKRARDAWLELAPLARLEIVREVIRKYEKGYLCVKQVKPVDVGAVGLAADADCAADGAAAGAVCVVIRKPIPCAVILATDIERTVPWFLNYLVEGGAVYVVNCKESSPALNLLFELLREADVPINTSDSYLHVNPSMYEMRVIWTSIGTTFAN